MYRSLRALRFAPLALLCPLWPQSEAVAQVVDRPRDDGLLTVPDIRVEVPKIGSPATGDDGNAKKTAPPTNLSDDDLKNNPRLADYVLSEAMKAQAWKIVEGILRYYRDIPGHDPMMALYAQGALDRQEGQHGHAIAAYREMVETDPSLDNVRFDLAAMLVEDKQFGEARKLLEILRDDPDLAPTARHAVQTYLAVVRQQTGWHGTIRLGYKYNDNVNQSSSDPYLYIWGLPFEKDPASLPHSANAINYYANIGRDVPLSGNHSLSVSGTVEGDDYWDDPAWRETTVTVQAGYKYRDIRSWLSVMPYYSQYWLGGHPYRRMLGISVEYGRWLSPKWQIIGSYAWFNKKYELPDYHIYDGNLHALSVTAVYFHSPHTVFYAGLNAQRDLLETKDESSSRDGASLGFIKLWNNGLNVRGNARYGFRRFRDYSLWDPSSIRRDQEYQVDLSVAYSKLRFAGLTPRLSYQYLKIGSSIPSIYSRTGNQITLSLETVF